MKRSSTYFILVLMTLLSLETKAQDLSSGISVRQNRVEIKDSTLYVNFDLDISGTTIGSDEGVVLTPVIQSPDRVKRLPQVIVNGRNRNIAYNRTLDRKSDRTSYNKPYAVVKIRKSGQTAIPYSLSIPFETWMENSTLVLQEAVWGCRQIGLNASNRVLAQHIGASSTPSPLLTYLSPSPEPPQHSKDSVRSVLLFPNAETTILSDYGPNRQNLASAAAVLTNRNLAVTAIHIVGAASPEGSYTFNEQLSKERALALSAFFEKNYNIPVQRDKIEWGGEDWGALLEQVAQSDMPHKQEVIQVIASTSVFAGRENKLMELHSGVPYRYMAESFFPQLRRVSYTIYYHPIPFDIARGRSLIGSDPLSLSADEMLLVADSYPTNSDEYFDITQAVLRRYPDNLMANINASSVFLSRADTAAAARYLDRVKQYAESWNNLGAMYMIEGNDGLARRYFQKAMDQGSPEAVRNMEKLTHK